MFFQHTLLRPSVVAVTFLLALAACGGASVPGSDGPSDGQTDDTPDDNSDDPSDSPEQPVHATSGYSILRPGNRYATAPVGDRYVDEVQPALAARCAVCHSCTNGPCQLNMTSYAALERGLSSTNPYKFGLFDSMVTRVSDNRPLSHWREKGFRSVLPGPGVAPTDSVFFKALALGDNNRPGVTQDEGPLKLSTTRALAQAHEDGAYVCPATSAEFKNLEDKYPQGGMPWALPVDTDVQSVLEAWVLDGAPAPSAAATAALRAPTATAFSKGDPAEMIAKWEAFLGGDSPKEQLTARYIYEHGYSANIHFTENPGEFYRIVRSKTAAPAPIDPIFTDMPQEAPPGYTGRVYFRLAKIDRVIEGKVHVPWELSLADLAHLKEQFLAPEWTVPALPGYSLNPFETFLAIPEAIRARFMIENSRMIFAQFARGPICLIQAASYAVDEHFWILFVKPESDPSVLVPRLGLPDYSTFFTKDGNVASGVPVLGDKYGEPTYRNAFEKTLRQLKPGGIGVQDIWTGDGWNANSWLTVHRHQFSVDVHTTLDRPITGLPKSVWLMTYANFERMYYNAVAQYKYWGNVKHQNDSFNWQIYTRSEAEDLWASLYPSQDYREELRDRFTNFEGKVYNKLFTDYAEGRPSASPWIQSEDQMGRALIEAMAPVLGPSDRLNNWPDAGLATGVVAATKTPADFEAGLRSLTNRAAPFAGFLPNVVHVRIGGEHLYSLLVVRGFSNNKMAIAEGAARRRENDLMVAVPGFAAYEAHMFVDLSFDQAAGFLTDLGAVKDKASWLAFDAKYKLARNSPKFWAFVDWLHGYMEQNIPVRAGLLELRVYDLTETPF
jgi:hypothetical protein